MIRRELVSRVQWQGQSWLLRVFDWPLADGITAEKGTIDHPGSVLIVAVDGGNVLMLRQYRLALDDWVLELPAGTREVDEPWLACARRELREETGFQANEWIELGQVWPAPGLTNEVMAIYLARDLSQAPLPRDEDEQIEVEPIPLERLVAMSLDGRLQDAKSVVGILRAADWLGR